MAEILKKLLRIFKQKGPSCFAYALCGLIEYKTGKLTKPQKFYELVKKDSRLNSGALTVLLYAKEKGIPLEDGGVIKIKDFKVIYKRGGKNLKKIWEICKTEPLFMCIDTQKGESLADRMNKDGYLRRRQNGGHSVVALQTINDLTLRCANSYGPEWPPAKRNDRGRLIRPAGDGYFNIRPSIQKKMNPFILSAYQIII